MPQACTDCWEHRQLAATAQFLFLCLSVLFLHVMDSVLPAAETSNMESVRDGWDGLCSHEGRSEIPRRGASCWAWAAGGCTCQEEDLSHDVCLIRTGGDRVAQVT